jgi:hypothetical protein
MERAASKFKIEKVKQEDVVRAGGGSEPKRKTDRSERPWLPILAVGTGLEVRT